jgi:hypothetical protein
MSGQQNQFSAERSRGEAHEAAAHGMGALARAFNHCENHMLPYRYADHVQAEFFELSVKIARLIEHGDIEPNPAHEQYRRAVAAKSDKRLQAVLRRASKRTPIRGQSRPPIFKGQST